jgi:hypothetical protein
MRDAGPRDVDRCQGGLSERGEADVVVAGDRDVSGDPQTAIAHGLDRAQGHEVVHAHNGTRPKPRGKHLARCLIPPRRAVVARSDDGLGLARVCLGGPDERVSPVVKRLEPGVVPYEGHAPVPDGAQVLDHATHPLAVIGPHADEVLAGDRCVVERHGDSRSAHEGPGCRIHLRHDDSQAGDAPRQHGLQSCDQPLGPVIGVRDHHLELVAMRLGLEDVEDV